MASGVRDDVSHDYTCFIRRGEDTRLHGRFIRSVEVHGPFLEAEAKAPPYRRNKVPEDADGSPAYPPGAAMVIETTSLAKNEEHLDRERLRESLWYWRRLVSSITSRRIMLQDCENHTGGEFHL